MLETFLVVVCFDQIISIYLSRTFFLVKFLKRYFRMSAEKFFVQSRRECPRSKEHACYSIYSSIAVTWKGERVQQSKYCDYNNQDKDD